MRTKKSASRQRSSLPGTRTSTRGEFEGIDATARQMRLSVAVSLAADFIRGYHEQAARDSVAKSPFRDHSQSFASDNPILSLSFTLAVTEAAVNAVLQQDLSPELQLFLASRIVEMGAYSIHDPRKPTEPTQYLGASKQFGYFFTPPAVALLIAETAIGNRTSIRQAIDPAAGVGALLGALLLVASERSVSVAKIEAIEQDPFTAGLLTRILENLISRLPARTELVCRVGDSIDMYGRSALALRSYDCVVMNPPYGRIKFLRSTLTNAETRVSDDRLSLEEQASFWKDKVDRQASSYREVADAVGVSSGGLDYQRIFIGIAQGLLAPGGRCAFISPSSWLGDRDGLELRKRILPSRELESVRIFPESCGLFATVNQPTSISCLVVGEPSSAVRVTIIGGRDLAVSDEYSIEVSTLLRLDPELLRIPRVSHEQHALCEQLQQKARLKDITWIKNARGELDQTQGKEYLQAEPTKVRLVRGDHIERYILRPPESSSLPSYVTSETFEARYRGSTKFQDAQRPRLAGRQVSYIQKGRRLSFSIVPANVVLGNSCNYLTVSGSPAGDEQALEALEVVLNSTVLEWYFRIFSGNNHVGNYEIDDFPLCLDTIETVSALAKVGRFLRHAYAGTESGGKEVSPVEDFADAVVAWAYGLSAEQVLLVFNAMGDNRGTRVAGMLQHLIRHGIPDGLLVGDGWHQHEMPTLSALDRQIISHVPQGGNWMDVPASVPSQRLAQIRKMSEWRGIVRTTYYGRLRPEQPSYTIATYYNRPGNGTNIHPWADRTLTNREAARLQSFPDWYLFVGKDGTVRKQIGNAVPPLLGYAVGTHIKPLLAGGDVVDLFAGAGGLSLGLELAGVPVAAAVEYDANISATYRFNRLCESDPDPSSAATLFLQADLSDEKKKAAAIEAIKEKLKGRTLGAIVGGPPCQGFSHAGWRSKSDARNNLAVVFLEVVEALNPNLVVLENVEGLLTFDGGRVLAGLQEALRDLGYSVAPKPWVLCAEQYGVPQMRRRVFLVGTRNEAPLQPPPPVFEQCRGRRETTRSRELFSTLPYPFTAGEALFGLPSLMDTRFKEQAPSRGRSGFNRWLRGLIPPEEMLEQSSEGRT